MKRSKKILIIAACATIAAGAAVFTTALAMNDWSIDRMMNVKYETNTYTLSDKFENLNIDGTIEDVIFRLSDDGACRVVCYEQEKMKHTAHVNNNTLDITVTDTREWYERISLFSFDSPKTTVYLPEKSYNSLSINTSTGNTEIPKDFIFGSINIKGSTGNVSCNASSRELTKIDLSTGNITVDGASSKDMQLSASTGNINARSTSCKGDLSVNVSTGKILLTDVSCNNLSSDGSTGKIELKNLIASQKLSIERSTGDVKLDGCDAEELYIKTDTGDVTGTLQSDKVFITDTSTGDINVPKTTSGGKCEIKTGTGDIRISINK